MDSLRADLFHVTKFASKINGQKFEPEFDGHEHELNEHPWDRIFGKPWHGHEYGVKTGNQNFILQPETFVPNMFVREHISTPRFGPAHTYIIWLYESQLIWKTS